jgi:hypothetical protein
VPDFGLEFDEFAERLDWLELLLPLVPEMAESGCVGSESLSELRVVGGLDASAISEGSSPPASGLVNGPT